MTKALAQTYTFAHQYRRMISTVLLAICLVLATGYAMTLYRAISHTLALRDIAAQSATIDAAIQALDTEYVALFGKISPDTLSNYGFSKGQVTAFIPRSSSGRVALANHE